MVTQKAYRGHISLREKLEFTAAFCSRYTIRDESGGLYERIAPAPGTLYSNNISYLSSDF
jgi:hypothetical protein